MCGIAGFIAADGAAQEAPLRGMLARIAHRGPDGQGMFVAGAAALGHCRLAIIDLAGGSQPLYSEDQNLVLIFNGEIYNYRALTAELTALGHTFATHTDTEVLLHGWEQWGRELLPRLRGMFAFALWDRRAQTLFCARDMFGIKPLYYCRCDDGTFLFGSEIKAFLDHPSFRKRFNAAQLPLYLSCQYSPGRDTFFTGVQKLLPGHFLEFSGGIVRTTRWVQPAFLPGDAPTPADIEAVLQDSVNAHKVADVEVAGFLSGGVDSAFLTALARPARSYTIRYSEARYDESAPARALARGLGLRNRVRCITPGEFWDAVPTVQYHMDEPLADAAAVALYFLNREAAKEVKVCLSGEGADELFGGYNIYRDPFTAPWYDALPAWLRGALGAAACLLPPAPGVNFLARRARPLPERYFGPTALFTEWEKYRLLPGYDGDGDPMFLTENLWDQTEDLDPVSRMQQVDLNLWLPGDILLKADKMSMAHGLELRVPFLDKEVFALAAALPAGAKADAKFTKIALRQAAARTLPAATATRKKLGFPVPVRDWLRQEPYTSRVRAVFGSPAAGQFFRPGVLHSMLNRHLHGGDCWRQIWCIYCFLLWYEQFFGV